MAAGTAAGCSEPAPEKAAAGFGVAQAALQAPDSVVDSSQAPASAPQAAVDPRIAAHQQQREALRGRSGAAYLRFLSQHGLRDHPDAEDCAVYVHQRWTQADQEALRNQGIAVNADVFIPAVPGHHPWGFHLARVPYTRMTALARDPNVARIATTELLAKPQNDLGRSAIKADLVQAGSGVTARSGKGVRICIADSSLDLTNSDVAAPSEVYDVTTGDAVGMWSNDVSGTVTAHGTHVVGTAVGSGGLSGGKYRGAAPGASYYFYKIGDNITGDSTATDQLKAIARAGVVGCNIFSMSYGNMGSEVDGSGPVEQAIDAHVDAGMTFFIAAGNDGDGSQHASVALQAGTSAQVLFSVDNTAGSSAETGTFNVDAAWRDVTPGDGNISLGVTGLNASAGETFTTTGFWTTGRDTERIEYDLTPAISAGGKKSYTLTVTNAPTGNAVTVHLYLVAATPTTTFDAPDSAVTVASPALADGALAIGAYVHRKNWIDWTNKGWQTALTVGDIAAFSSRGPRIDGVQKPELVAPGSMTISTRDSHVTLGSTEIIDDDGLNQNGSGPAHYTVMEGTSMACPMAAGAAALLLEAAPGLKPAFVRKFLTQAASAALWPDYAQGYGLIDIKAAIIGGLNTCGDGWVSGFEQCDDGNTSNGDCCTSLCKKASDGVPCSSNSMCVSNEKCSSGKCQGGTAMSCNDSDACTDDACDPVSGCSHTQNTAPCDDGEVCTTNDKCVAFVCVGGPPPKCTDGNVCTSDSCLLGVGCIFVANASVCSDGNACTTSDACSAKVCVGGPALDCNDGNVCTNDSCNAAAGCIHAANTVACDDGNSCTSTDVCKDKLCAGTVVLSCDDGNICTTDECSGGVGCQHLANTTACDDGDPCTAGDACAAKVCVGGPAKSCDDGNVCTDDSCAAGTGCKNVANTAPCNDGNICTATDVCSNSACVGATSLNCNDGNACTDDGCATPGGCVHVANSVPCSDGSACTVGDACANSQCASGVAMNCSDGNACTDDSCNAVTACLHIANQAPCNDGSVCTTGDHCSGGSCMGGGALPCDDKNPCTDDGCDAAGGCTHTANTGTCDDGNACTTGDTCYWKACVSGTALFCGDANLCTDDSCDPVTGCSNLANTAACNDGNACTVGDVCANKACVGGAARNCDDNNACTLDGCDSSSGCTHVAMTGPCSDGSACTTGDTCAAKKCVGTGVVVCNDGDPCTDDSCDAATGCKTTGNSALCDDGDACTYGDMCVNKACTGGTKLNCDDGNPCTADSCDKVTGCVSTPNASACDDGDPCTVGDACASGSCVGGSGDGCNDGNACTTDTCSPSQGCQHSANTAACDDGNACTAQGVCSGGICQVGAIISCDDNNLCTDDSCEPATGCSHSANSAACEDGDACTVGDQCAAGVCKGGAATGCPDAGATDAGADTQATDIASDVAKDAGADPAPDVAADSAADTATPDTAAGAPDAQPGPDGNDVPLDAAADAAAPDAALPDAAQPDVVQADVAKADIAPPDVSAAPDATDVQAAKPDVDAVQASGPDAAAAPVAGLHKAAASGCSAGAAASRASAVGACLLLVAAAVLVARRRRA